jgi:hypothetical protein
MSNPLVIPDLNETCAKIRKSVIVLTFGLSGSSVLTGLVARAGYWTGEETFKKEYDTHENQDLILLNSALLKAAAYHKDFTAEFSWDAINQVSSLHETIDLTVYKEFIAKCNAHSPWIWKDPRLYLTIRFWAKLMELKQVKFILLTRDPVQAWISQQLRRQVCTYRFFRNFEDVLRDSLVKFLEENCASYLVLRYEDLILNPEGALAKLNPYIDVALTVSDLRTIYTGPLYRMPKSHWDLAKALAIYVKNYPERRR